ncbi:hypothetical protein H7347_04500 [Corynebacterium sp. zg-331]|uniref:hypothetical protein n=1 Tax=unclassified Corynebacterium TaxID=2624378 RepID=UPI00128B1BE2|nr:MULTISPECIES: hypothetical protein [unclassified Corynebacterium]MBC3185838.1 hypothetical protein [Corynebacterium sp. zg-331]MPV52329.1 hypothetical protein [Corynebacterium sp. zg331]
MLVTILKGLALAMAGLFSLGGTPFSSSEAPVAETVAASEATDQGAEDRQAAAEASVQAIEDEAGHDLVSVEFDGDSVVLRQVDSFDEQADQGAFAQITEALKALGYEKISTVGKPLYAEKPELDLSTLVDEDTEVEAAALPAIDPAFSRVIRA